MTWNVQLLRGDVEQAVRDLKEQPGGLLIVGGARLPQSLAKWGLIDEYEFVIHPIVAGHGPRLLTGLPNQLRLELLRRRTFASGAVFALHRPATTL